MRDCCAFDHMRGRAAVQEMYAFTLSAYKAGIRGIDLHLRVGGCPGLLCYLTCLPSGACRVLLFALLCAAPPVALRGAELGLAA
jgi:hypothetical protein